MTTIPGSWVVLTGRFARHAVHGTVFWRLSIMHAKGNDCTLKKNSLPLQKLRIPVLSLLCIALVITSGCTGSTSPPATAIPTSIPLTIGNPDTPQPTTAPPAAVEIMTLTAACQINDSVSIEGTVKSTASRPVTIVVRGSTYDAFGTRLGSGSDFVGIDPDGTSAFTLIVPGGCDSWEGTYDAWIDEVL